MMEQLDEREIRYLGQEAMLALQNKALIRVTEAMSASAMDDLVMADPTDFKAVAICQLRLKAIAELADALESMAARGEAIEAEEVPDPRDLN